MTEAELGAKMLAQARAEKHRPGLPKNPGKPPGPSAEVIRTNTRCIRARKRRACIAALLDQGMTRPEARKALSVSDQTFRRDIRALEQEGRI